MKKYKKKPVVIEAEQWFKLGDVPEAKIQKYVSKYGWIKTLEGGHKVSPKDWIIKGVKGEYYPCKPDIFEMTYAQLII